jgi:multiple sugar transport system permease protein
MATEQQQQQQQQQGYGWNPISRSLNWMEGLSEQSYAYLLLTPAFLVLTAIALWPLWRTFRVSLYADNLFSAAKTGEFVGLANYVDVLTNNNPLLSRPLIDLTGGTPFFRQALLVTVAFAVLSVVFETLIGFGQAYIMSKEYRGRRWVRVAIILPWAIPIVIQGMLFFLLFNPSVGFLSDPLQSIGLFSANPLTSSTDAFAIVTVADIWKTSAFMALLILAGMQSVDKSLYDVAEVAGASPWQRFRHITLPLIFPALMVAMLFRTIDAMRIYGIIEASGAGCGTVPSLSCLVVDTMFGITQAYASAATIAFLTATIIALVIVGYLVALKLSPRGSYQ